MYDLKRIKYLKVDNKINALIRIDKQLNQAFNYHQKGNLREAEKIYREILQNKPDNDTVLYLLGTLASQSGQYETAINLLNKAIEINPAADYYKGLGDILYNIGKKQEASQFYRKTIELNPDDEETSFNLALLCQQLGNIDEAIRCFENVVRLNPKDVDAFNSLGALFFNNKRDFVNAEKCFNRVVELKHGFVDGYFNLGLVYTALKQNDKAISSYNKVIKLNPKHTKAYFKKGLLFGNDYDKTIECYTKLIEFEPQNADAYYNLANAYRSKDQGGLTRAGLLLDNNIDKSAYLNKAIKYYEKAIELDPNLAQAYNNLATIYSQNGNMDKAQICLQKAIKLKPDFCDAYINLAALYLNINEFDLVEEYYFKALNLKPNSVNLYIKIGDFYYNTGEYNKSKEYYSKALELNPDSIEAKWALSSIYIMMQDFEKGWEYYESRFYINSLSKPNLPAVSQPRWTGKESLDGKTLLIYYEQGLGDTIQFIRYAYELKNKINAKILFKPQSDSLVKLLRQSNPDVEIVDLSTPDETIEFDYYVPLMSLPYILGARFDNIPYTSKYIKTNPDDVNYYKEKYFNNNKFKIGIVWSNKNLINLDKLRSMQNIKYFYDMAKLEGVQVYSLQKGSGESQLNDLPEDVKIINLGETFNNLADTAAAIENLDVVLSVDTSVVHLAAALGKPTWVLLNYTYCWRWFIGLEHSPWYESARIFKCQKMNDYDNMMKNVTEKLKKLVEKTVEV